MVEMLAIKIIEGDEEILGPGRIAHLLIAEVERVQSGNSDSETVSLLIAAAAYLVVHATEQMAADEQRIDLLRRIANSKYLHFSYLPQQPSN